MIITAVFMQKQPHTVWYCLIDHIRDFGHFCRHGNNSFLHVMFITQKCHLSNLK